MTLAIVSSDFNAAAIGRPSAIGKRSGLDAPNCTMSNRCVHAVERRWSRSGVCPFMRRRPRVGPKRGLEIGGAIWYQRNGHGELHFCGGPPRRGEMRKPRASAAPPWESGRGETIALKGRNEESNPNFALSGLAGATEPHAPGRCPGLSHFAPVGLRTTRPVATGRIETNGVLHHGHQ